MTDQLAKPETLTEEFMADLIAFRHEVKRARPKVLETGSDYMVIAKAQRDDTFRETLKMVGNYLEKLDIDKELNRYSKGQMEGWFACRNRVMLKVYEMGGGKTPEPSNEVSLADKEEE